MTYNELCERIMTAKEEMLKSKIEANSVTLNGRKYGKLVENCPVNMKPTIFGMAVNVDYAMPDDYDFLVQYEPPKPQTNADRIRAMTDEELAEYLCKAIRGGIMMLFPDSHYSKDEIAELNHDWLDWLRQEVET